MVMSDRSLMPQILGDNFIKGRPRRADPPQQHHMDRSSWV